MTELAQIVAVLRKLAEIHVFKCGERLFLFIWELQEKTLCKLYGIKSLRVDISTLKENIKATVTHIQGEKSVVQTRCILASSQRRWWWWRQDQGRAVCLSCFEVFIFIKCFFFWPLWQQNCNRIKPSPAALCPMAWSKVTPGEEPPVLR